MKNWSHNFQMVQQIHYNEAYATKNLYTNIWSPILNMLFEQK